MKMPLLVLGLLLVFLTGCGHTAARRDPPPSTDLQVLMLGVKALTEPNEVQGPIQHREQAETNGDLWVLSGRQDDVIDLEHDDKRRLRQFIAEAVAAIERGRQPECRWWQFGCKREREASPLLNPEPAR